MQSGFGERRPTAASRPNPKAVATPRAKSENAGLAQIPESIADIAHHHRNRRNL